MSAASEYFRSKLEFEIDVLGAYEQLTGGHCVLVDTRRHASWEHGHVPGALHLPTALIPAQAHVLIPAGTPVVVYSWGPGCNGSTFAALALAELGYPVKEMIGGIEYWIRNGLPLESAAGVASQSTDPLVTTD
ncbi:rhodanese-like domain-containing protein [Arthrobacter psychrolactophilus]